MGSKPILNHDIALQNSKDRLSDGLEQRVPPGIADIYLNGEIVRRSRYIAPLRNTSSDRRVI